MIFYVPNFHQAQIMIGVKNKTRLGISLLLVLFLLLAATKTPFSAGLLETGGDKPDVLFVPSLMGCELSTIILDRRTNYNPFDCQSKGTLIAGRIVYDFTIESFLFLLEYNTGFTQVTVNSAKPIRAPPLPS
jgi:hypothetical protein